MFKKRKTVRQSYFHRNPYCTFYSRVALNEQNHMSCQLHIFTSGFPHNPLLRSALAGNLSRNWFVIRSVQEGSKGQLKHFSYRPTEQRHSQNLSLIFGVTGLCLSVTGHKAWAEADSLHPAYVIISTDSSPISVFVLLLKAHWLKSTTYYPSPARE